MTNKTQRTPYIVAIIGKTSSGKDTIAKYFEQKYNIPQIISFATRPIRDSEIEGREHYFITDERMDEILSNKSDVLAFVKFPKTGFRYCATKSAIPQGKNVTYIIDPSGLTTLKEAAPEINLYPIYVDLDEDVIRERALIRGDKKENIETRLDSERELFREFKDSRNYEYLIHSNQPQESVQKEVDRIMQDIIDKENSIYETLGEKDILQKEFLKELRSQIVLNSIYLKDYQNTFNITLDSCSDFFDGYVDFLTNICEEDLDIPFADGMDIVLKYDNIDNLYEWYLKQPTPVFEYTTE